MRVHIASSWRNRAAVEMLTHLLRGDGHDVFSFVEYAEETGEIQFVGDEEEWIETESAGNAFEANLEAATRRDVVVYIGPSGVDAWTEVAAAFVRGIPVVGIWAKSEPAGLCRRMVEWVDSYTDVLNRLRVLHKRLPATQRKRVAESLRRSSALALVALDNVDRGGEIEGVGNRVREASRELDDVLARIRED